MNNFVNDLSKEMNKVETGNGEVGYKSTLNKVLDYNMLTGNSRFVHPNKIKQEFDNAYSENPILATKALFYGRDILEGGGDKKLGRLSVRALIDKLPISKYETLFELVIKYGSYKDLVMLLGQKSLQEEQIKILSVFLINKLAVAIEKLDNGQNNNQELLVAKYLPTETTKSSYMKLAYLRLIDSMNLTRKQYRKVVSKLRKELNLVETKLTNKDYNIDYSKVPSQAIKKYNNAFLQNDYEDITSFFDKVKHGEAKVNTKTLEPYQLVHEYLNSFSIFTGSKIDDDKDNYLSTLWNNLPELESNLSALPLIDVSASMGGLPMEVAISLGMYLAENNKNESYHNKFITFSDDPSLITIPETDSLKTKVKKIAESDWDGSTDLEKAFNLILKAAINNNLSQNELPDTLVIISDMNFNEATSNFVFTDTGVRKEGLDDTFFDKMNIKFENQGYKLPFVVFWNVDGNYYSMDNNSNPVVKSDKNTCLVSGFSKNIYKNIMDLDLEELEEYTPEKVLLKALNNERYDDVEKLFK